MQPLVQSCASFSRSAPWHTTTSRNTCAFQEVSIALLWETWKLGSGWNILRTPKTNPFPSPTGIHTRAEIRECIYEHLAVVHWGQCTDRVQGQIHWFRMACRPCGFFCSITKSMNLYFIFVKSSIICSIINIKDFFCEINIKFVICHVFVPDVRNQTPFSYQPPRSGHTCTYRDADSHSPVLWH